MKINTDLLLLGILLILFGLYAIAESINRKPTGAQEIRYEQAITRANFDTITPYADTIYFIVDDPAEEFDRRPFDAENSPYNK